MGCRFSDSILDAILTEKPYPLKVWIERSGNKFGVLGNASSWEPAMKKLDFIVHMYMYPTSFSTYADMILPTTEWLETNMLIDCMNYVFARQAVVHTYETVDETLIWSWILRRCASSDMKAAKRPVIRSSWVRSSALADYGRAAGCQTQTS